MPTPTHAPKFAWGTQADYDLWATPDDDTIFFTSDTRRLYVGATLMSIYTVTGTGNAFLNDVGLYRSLAKSDVGLSNVPDVDCTNAANIVTGTLSTGVMPNYGLAAETGTGSDNTTPLVASNALSIILQTIWNKIHQVVNAVQSSFSSISGTLTGHTMNTSNPHGVTLTQASTAQANTNLDISNNSAFTIYYKGTSAARELATKADVDAAVSGSVVYMGQVKFGADTVATMNSIASMSNGDKCGVQATQLTYTWDGTNWIADAAIIPTVTAIYDLVFWYGTWNSVQHTGDVSASIKYNLNTAYWDLIVYDDAIVANEINDTYIGPRTISTPSASTTINTGPLTLTAWLQAIMNNITSLFTSVANAVMTTSFGTATTNNGNVLYKNSSGTITNINIPVNELTTGMYTNASISSLDFSTYTRQLHSITGNRTLGQSITGLAVGQTGHVVITNGTSTDYTIDCYGSVYEPNSATALTTGSKVITVHAGAAIECSILYAANKYILRIDS